MSDSLNVASQLEEVAHELRFAGTESRRAESTFLYWKKRVWELAEDLAASRRLIVRAEQAALEALREDKRLGEIARKASLTWRDSTSMAAARSRTAELVAAVKSFYFFVRAFQDAALGLLCGLIPDGQHPPEEDERSVSMEGSLQWRRSDPTSLKPWKRAAASSVKCIEDRVHDYVRWFHGMRKRRNFIKKGTGTSYSHDDLSVTVVFLLEGKHARESLWNWEVGRHAKLGRSAEDFIRNAYEEAQMDPTGKTKEDWQRDFLSPYFSINDSQHAATPAVLDECVVKCASLIRLAVELANR